MSSRRPTVEQLEDRNLLSVGFLDSSFGAAGVATAHFAGFDSSAAVGAVVQPDGKIVVAGAAGSGTYALARFNANGTLDNTFGTGGEVTTAMGGIPVGIVLQSDGKIIVGGTCYVAFGMLSPNGFGMVRYNRDGSLDTSFGNGGKVTVELATKSRIEASGILLQPDGKIVMVGGTFSPYSQSYVTELLRFNTDGSEDPGFPRVGLPGLAGSAALQSDGKIVVPGPRQDPKLPFSYPYYSYTDFTWFLDRLNQDGSSDIGPSVDFGRGPNQNITVAIQSDGKIVTAGSAGQPALARLNPDGTLDTSFGVSGKLLTPLSGSLAIQSDGRILITSHANGSSGFGGLMRYLPDGSVDTGFGIDGSASPFPSGLGSGITLQSDGSILVMGSVPAASGDLAVARYVGGASVALTGTLNQRFVQQIYLDVLQRPAELGGLTFWSGLLDNGQATRIQVVQGIQQSAEYRSLVVGSLYNLYFHRPVDATGLADWTSFLASGGTADQLRAQLLGSDEYARAHSGGDTGPSFLEGLYHDVLYRTMDSVGETAWTQALNNGASNAAVALAIIQSQEGATGEVQGLYHRLLHRPPDATGLSQFSSALEQGTSNDLILALIASSDEYVARL
jgi:uncharacterized delta-60 repeat protein